MIRAFSPHCPNCAAALRVDPASVGSTVECEYCGSTLLLERQSVRFGGTAVPPAPASAPATDDGPLPAEPPPPTLYARDAPRFSLRILEQRAEGARAESFETFELSGDRFALVLLRCTTDDGETVDVDLAPAYGVLEESLDEDGDPGLAVNLALEELTRDPRFEKLEALVALFDPARATMVAYAAGRPLGAYWVSTEEGRAIVACTLHQPLEKSDLSKEGSHFDNGRTISLAALDVVVVASFSLFHDPAMKNAGASVYGDVLRKNVGEEPERLVTLVKNAWWESRARQRGAEVPPERELRIAAVGARLAEPDPALGDAIAATDFATRRFGVAVQRSPGDRVELREIDGGRSALVLVRAAEGAEIPEGPFDALLGSVLEVLGNRDHGNFDNPREAGRRGFAAYLAAGGSPAGVSLVVAHLSDEHGRVKYFCHQSKLAFALGARRSRPDQEQQQFDGGGEVSLSEHERLLFPGSAAYEGEVKDAADLAGRWPGGKSSHLLEAIRLHWRTRKTPKAFRKLAAAAAADGAAGAGMILIQGRGGS